MELKGYVENNGVTKVIRKKGFTGVFRKQ